MSERFDEVFSIYARNTVIKDLDGVYIRTLRQSMKQAVTVKKDKLVPQDGIIEAVFQAIDTIYAVNNRQAREMEADNERMQTDLIDAINGKSKFLKAVIQKAEEFSIKVPAEVDINALMDEIALKAQEQIKQEFADISQKKQEFEEANQMLERKMALIVQENEMQMNEHKALIAQYQQQCSELMLNQQGDSNGNGQNSAVDQNYQIQKLQDEKHQLEQEIKTFKLQIQNLEQQSTGEQYQQVINQLKEELQQTKNNNIKNDQEIVQNDQIETHEQFDTNDSRIQIIQIQSELNKWKAKHDDANQQLQEKQQIISVLQEEKQLKTTELEKQQNINDQQNQQFQLQLNELENQVKQKEVEIQQLQQDVNDTSNVEEHLRTVSQQSLEKMDQGDAESLAQQVQQLQNNKQLLEDQLKEAIVQKENLEGQVTELNQWQIDMKSNCDKLKDDSDNLERIQQENVELKQQLAQQGNSDALTQQIQELKQQLVQNEEMIDIAKQLEVEQVENKQTILTLQQQLEKMQKDIIEKDQQIIQNSDLAKTSNSDLKSVQHEYSKLQQDNEQLQNSIKNLQDDFSKKKQDRIEQFKNTGKVNNTVYEQILNQHLNKSIIKDQNDQCLQAIKQNLKYGIIIKKDKYFECDNDKIFDVLIQIIDSIFTMNRKQLQQREEELEALQQEVATETNNKLQVMKQLLQFCTDLQIDGVGHDDSADVILKHVRVMIDQYKKDGSDQQQDNQQKQQSISQLELQIFKLQQELENKGKNESNLQQQIANLEQQNKVNQDNIQQLKETSQQSERDLQARNREVEDVHTRLAASQAQLVKIQEENNETQQLKQSKKINQDAYEQILNQYLQKSIIKDQNNIFIQTFKQNLKHGIIIKKDKYFEADNERIYDILVQNMDTLYNITNKINEEREQQLEQLQQDLAQETNLKLSYFKQLLTFCKNLQIEGVENEDSFETVLKHISIIVEQYQQSETIQQQDSQTKQQSLSQLELKIEKQQQQLEQSIKQDDNSRQQIKTLTEHNVNYTNENKQLNEKLDQLQKDYNARIAEIQQLQQKCTQIENQLLQYQNETQQEQSFKNASDSEQYANIFNNYLQNYRSLEVDQNGQILQILRQNLRHGVYVKKDKLLPNKENIIDTVFKLCEMIHLIYQKQVEQCLQLQGSENQLKLQLQQIADNTKEKELQELQQKHEQLRQQFNQLEIQNMEISKVIKQHQEQIQEKDMQLQNSQQQLDIHIQKLNEQNELNLTQSDSNQQLQKEINQINQKCKQFEQEQNQLQNTITEKEQQINSLNLLMKQQNKDEQMQQYIVQINQQRSDIEVKQKEIQEIQLQLDQLQQETVTYQKQNQILETQKVNIETNLQKLLGENKNLSEKNQQIDGVLIQRNKLVQVLWVKLQQ